MMPQVFIFRARHGPEPILELAAVDPGLMLSLHWRYGRHHLAATDCTDGLISTQ